jgi:hypothetical protein
MSYASRAALGFDAGLRDRIIVCAREQALIYKDDADPANAALADSILENGGNAQPLVDLVLIAPDFVDVENSGQITDGQILAATQATWPTYAGAVFDVG